MDSQNVTFLVLLDLSAAINSVRHDVLLGKLYSLLAVTCKAYEHAVPH